MKYTPRDISHQVFPSKMSGFDRSAVQAFLADVATDLEATLRHQQELEKQVAQLTAELAEKKEQEEEIRRVVIAAERIAHDMKENAIRESELLLAQAHASAQEVQKQQEARTSQFEMAHQERVAALEIAFRTRFTDLEREQHELTLAREREHAQRSAHLEKQFSEQYLELSSRLNAARQEYSQFLNGYRALVSSFSELSSRHLLPEATPLPQHPAKLSTPPATPPSTEPKSLRVIDQSFQSRVSRAQ